MSTPPVGPTHPTRSRGLLLALAVALCAVVGVVAPAPSAVAATPLSAGAYVFAGLQGSLAAIDRTTGAVAATVALPGEPTDVETGAASGNVYAAVGGSVFVVNATSVTITRTITSTNAKAKYVSLALAPDGTRLYALDQTDNLVDVYDPRTGAPISSIPVLAQVPWSIEISPDGAAVYVVYSESPTLTVISTAYPPGVSASHPLPSTGEAVAFDPAGQVAYVLVDPPAGGGTNSSVAVVDTATGAVTATWASALGGLGSGVALSPDGSRLYVADQGAQGGLVVLSTSTGTILHTQTIAFPAPDAIRVSPDGATVYVATTGNQIARVDTRTWADTPIGTTADVNAISLVDLAAPVFESTAGDTWVAGTAHRSEVVTAAFPRAALTVTGTLPAGITFTDNGNGTGTFSGTASVPGAYAVQVEAANSVGASFQSYTIRVVTGPPAVLEATVGGGQTTAPGTTFPTQVQATLRDGAGNPIANAPVTFTVDPAGSASFSGVPSYTASTQSDGTVVAPFVLAGSAPGSLAVVATYAGLPPATFPLTISAGTPPGAPTITAVTPGDGSVQVAFTPGSTGSAPTGGYRVVATDVTAPARGGQTADGSSSPITVPGLTNGDTYTFTVTALSGDGNSAPSAASAPVVVGVPSDPPGPPTIDALATGDGAVTVTFTPGAAGGSPTTGYLVTATDATDPSRGGQTATGTASPIRVTGLTNADAYSFTVTALSASGNSAPSTASALINVGVPAQISGTPPRGTVGGAYSYQFTLSGVPAPTLSTSGTLPPGLTLDQSGLLHGQPTSAGSYAFTVEAVNGVGRSSVSPTVVIGNALGGVGPTPTPSPSPTPSPTSDPSPSPGPTPSTSTSTSTSSSSSPARWSAGLPYGGGGGYPGTGGYAATGSGAGAYSGSGLAHTGAGVGWLVLLAVLLLAGGAVAVRAGRSRGAGASG